MKTNSICLLSMVLALALLGGGVGCGRKKAAGAAARVIKVTTVQPVVRTFRSSLRAQGTVTILQGVDMGAPSRIVTRWGPVPGSPVEVSGEATPMP